MHYHVGHNMPGYLPESDVYTVRTKTEAIDLLIEEKGIFTEYGYDIDGLPEYRVEGNARTDLGYAVYCLNESREIGDRRRYPDAYPSFLIWADSCDCEDGEEYLETGDGRSW